MNLLVSDYDSTFYVNDNDIKNNIKYVDIFMKQNKFVIATGRSYFHYSLVRDLHNIKCNYLIINHGATIIKDNKIIYNKKIDNNIKNNLIEDLKLDKAVNIFCCSLLDNYDDLDKNDLTKIHIQYDSKETAKEIDNLIKQKYYNYLNCFFIHGKQAIEIVSKDADKSKVIKFVSNLENIKESDIYTIGDGYSDIEMIKNFNGARMLNCVDELKQVTNRSYESVSQLIEEIIFKRDNKI